MKFFTKEWFSGELSDKEIDKRQKDYWEYIDATYSRLPFVLKLLAKRIHLHDAILDRIVFNQTSRNLVIQSLCGDLEEGYFYLTITYCKVNLDDSKLKLFKDQKIEILSDEIDDCADGRFAHRLLTVFGNELEICFEDVKIEISSAIDKSRKRLCRVEILE